LFQKLTRARILFHSGTLVFCFEQKKRLLGHRLHERPHKYLQTRRITYAVTLFDHGLDYIKHVAFFRLCRSFLLFNNTQKHTGLSRSIAVNKTTP